jgi:hypothetical protein
MSKNASHYTAFAAGRRIARGDLLAVALQSKAASDRGECILVFDDLDGRQVDLNFGGDAAAVRARYAPSDADGAVSSATERRSRGRPRLGVVAREVTLLPRHWDWLATQPGGASVTLRKLVEQARRDGSGGERRRQAREAAYAVMAALGGNFAGFEDAVRALFASDREAFLRRMQSWPADVRDYVADLAAAAFGPIEDGGDDGLSTD